MITVDQAFELVASHVSVLPPVPVPLQDTLGLVLQSDVASDLDLPPFAKAMMDGYAVAANDTSVERTIVERVMAGDVPTQAIAPGQATQVMTGAPVPAGASAIVPVEKTTELPGGRVRIEANDLPAGKHIQPQGSLRRCGQRVVATGTWVTPHVMAALAEAGAAQLKVTPRPTVSILVTGDELVDVDQQPAAGQIRNSNGPMLAALATQANAHATVLPRGSDELPELTRLVAEGLASDVLLVTGGVSAGVKDLVPQALAAAGVQQVFHKVALKPGKPLWFGVARRSACPPTMVFGLPGNPISGLACFHLFVRPALQVLAGWQDEFQHPWRQAVLASGFAHPAGREAFRPAVVDESQRVEWCHWQGSADLAGMAEANCLVRLPAQGADFSPGSTVTLLPL